jgi:AmmeMemoRadiSam system protein A
MDPSHWPELFRLAVAALHAGFDGRRPAPGDIDAAPAGVFVTIEVDGELNGCIGALEPEPLGAAVPRLAWDAAFADPRLPALRPHEHDATLIKISLLSPLEPIDVKNEAELLAVLRPEVDGLLVEDRGRRATFLPAVWRHGLTAPSFVHQLLAKAGLPGWSPTMRVWRYTTEERSAKAKEVPHHLRSIDLDGTDTARDA